MTSVAEPEPPGAATFRVEPEPIFFMAGPKSRSRLSAPAASFWQAKEESLVLVTHMTQEQFIKRKYDPEKTCTNNSLFKSSK